jgi:hypothetical protein
MGPRDKLCKLRAVRPYETPRRSLALAARASVFLEPDVKSRRVLIFIMSLSSLRFGKLVTYFIL